ncbi:hypothetical protein OROGR_014039 [Orobanche gracilis]
MARILFLKIRPSQKILKIRDVTPLEAEDILTYIKSPRNGSAEEMFTYIKKPSKRIGWHFSSKFDVPSDVVQKKRVAQILPSQKILKIRDVTPLEAEDILTYIKSPRNGSVSHFFSKFDVNSNVVQKKRVARILFFKIRPSQEILKIRDDIPLKAEEIFTYIKKPSKRIGWHFSSKFDVPSNVVQKKRVARILFFKIRPSQKILKIRDVTPLEAEDILTYKKTLETDRFGTFLASSMPSQEILKIHDGTHLEFDIPSNVVQKKRVARILFLKIRPSQKILKIRDVTPLEAEDILTYIKSPRNGSVSHFFSKFDVNSNVVQKKRVARILFFKIRPSQEILKIHDDTPLKAEEIFTYIKKPSKRIDKFDIPSNVVQKKRVARILFLKIRPSQKILKIRDVTPLEAEDILTYIKSPRNGSVSHFFSKFDVNSNVVQKKRVARILFFKIRPSQEILKIRDDTPLKAEEIFTYIKKPSKRIGWNFSSKFDVPSNVVQKKRFDIPSNVVQKKRVARILFLKIRPSQKILKIRDVTPLEAEDILTYIKIPRNGSVSHFFSKFDVNSNVVQKKRVARILFFKIRPSQEILKIRDDTPLKAGEIFTYIKKPSKRIGWHFSSKFDVPSNVVQKRRVAQILFFKIRPSQKILKIRDVTPLEAEDILTYKKTLETDRFGTFLASSMSLVISVWHFSSKFDIPSNVVQKKRVARILFLKIRPSQTILKIRDVTPLEAEDILTYIKSPRNGSVSHFFSKFDVNSNVVQKKRVARILFFKIRPSQEILKIRDVTPLEKRVARILFLKIRPSQKILKIRDVTPLEAEDILTYIKSPRNGSVSHFFSKFDVNSNVVQKKRVAWILFFKIRPSQEILKIRDDIPLKAEEIFTYIKKPSKRIGWHFSSKFDVPSNVVQKKRVARILFFKISPSQKILKIRDVTPLEAEDILTYKKKPSKWIGLFDIPSNVVQKKRVARILFLKIRPSQKILKIRDVTPLEAEDILTYIKIPRNGSVSHFFSKFDVNSNVVQKKRVARILFFKIRPSQEILKIRDDTPLKAGEIFTYIKKPSKRIGWHFSSKFDVPSNVVQKRRVAQILFFKIRPSQKILKIRDVTPLEAEDILTYTKSPRNGSVSHFFSKFDVNSNVVQKKRVARILFFKIRPSQEILKIRDDTPLKAEKIFTYIKKPSKRISWNFSSKFDVPSNVVQKKRVARILFFKIRPSQKILKIRDVTPLEAEDILTYKKKPSKRIGLFDIPSIVVQKKRVARILFLKIRPSQKILKIRDVTPLEAEDILTYIKSPRNGSVSHFFSKFDVNSNVVQKKRVARILFFKIRPSQEILKIRDDTPLKAEEIFTYIKKPSKRIGWHFSSKFDVPSNVVQKKRVARILFFKIRPSQKILKIRDVTPLEAGDFLHTKKPSKRIGLFDIPSNVVQKKRVARILFLKIRPSQKILKIRDVTPLEAEDILTYIKSPRNGSVSHFFSKFDVNSNVVQKKRVARILFFKIRPSQEILKIRDDTPLKAEEIFTYIKKLSKRIGWHFSSKFDVPSNVVQKKRVARILFFKIRPSQKILKIRDVTPLEAEDILTYKKTLETDRFGTFLASSMSLVM